MEEAVIVSGNRGGRVLVYNQNRYQKNKTSNSSIHWRCWRKECRVPLTTDLFDLDAPDVHIHVTQEGEHNHDPDTEVITRSNLVNQMTQEIEDDPTSPVRRVYDGIITGVEVNDAPQYSNVKTKLERVRAKLMPPVPRSVDNVNINDPWNKTWQGDLFLNHVDRDWGILLFATEENLRVLQSCRDVYIDGTFKTCPRPYTQMVTIHGKRFGRVVALVICLMTGKETGQYRQMFQRVKAEVRRITGHRWRPQRAISDFEMSLHNALETELPFCQSVKCYFHFCQSLWRKMQDIGLAVQYRQHDRLKRCIHKFMALGHLPLALVRQNFNYHSTSRDTRRLCRRYDALQQFIDYMRQNYIDGQFPPVLWNVFSRDADTRTNNHVEGFHHRWNQKVGRQHPSLWIFIRKLKDEQKVTEGSLASGARGEDVPKRRKKCRHLKKRIRSLRQEYNSGERTLDEFWVAISYLTRQY